MITSFNQLDLSKQYSYADYLTWNFEERVEILKGWILKLAAPNRYHQQVSMKLVQQLLPHFGNKCQLFSAPFDVRLTLSSDLSFEHKRTKVRRISDEEITTVVQPDLCVFCNEDLLDDRGGIGAPDLVIEILSPGNSNAEMRDKFKIYEEVGVKEYWIVHPVDKTLLLYVLREGVFIGLQPFTAQNMLFSPTFPEINFLLDDIFPEYISKP